jgi:ferritin
LNLTESLNAALNQQVLKEYHNQFVYAQFESYFADLQLMKISNFFGKRSDEEKSHADKFMEHINSRTGGKVLIEEVPAPNLGELNLMLVAELYIRREEDTTKSIESLYELADYEKSYVDLPFLLEMLAEQVSEEDEANEFAMKANNVKDLVLWDSTFE